MKGKMNEIDKKTIATLIMTMLMLSMAVAAIPIKQAAAAGDENTGYYPSLIQYADGTAKWTTVQQHTDDGDYSVKLSAGTIADTSAGRIYAPITPILLDGLEDPSYWVYEPTVLASELIPTHPYVNIVLDLDGDLSTTNDIDRLEGMGSLTIDGVQPIKETWTQMKEANGYYDSDDSISGTDNFSGLFVWHTLGAWITYMGTHYANARVVGIEITYGFWSQAYLNLCNPVYVDDITVDVTVIEDFEPRIALDYAFYKMDDVVKATVFDIGLNTHIANRDSGTFTAEFDTNQITVSLLETGPNTSIFEGTFTVVEKEEPEANELLVEDGGTVTATYSTVSATATIDAEKPTITGIAPKDAAFIKIATPNILANLADTGGSGIASATMKLDGVLVKTVGAGAATIPYTVSASPKLAEGSHTVIVTASDVAGNIKTKTWTFTLAPDVIDSTITLFEGWNLISMPLIPYDSSIGVVLADVIENVEVVYGYESGIWSTYVSSVPELATLTNIEDGKGYWVKMTADDTLIVYGTVQPAPGETPRVYNVYNGWNLIGFKSTSTTTKVGTYLTTVPETLTDHMVIYGWDATDGYELVYPGVFGLDNTFAPGSGYWLYLIGDAVIVP